MSLTGTVFEQYTASEQLKMVVYSAPMMVYHPQKENANTGAAAYWETKRTVKSVSRVLKPKNTDRQPSQWKKKQIKNNIKAFQMQNPFLFLKKNPHQQKNLHKTPTT